MRQRALARQQFQEPRGVGNFAGDVGPASRRKATIAGLVWLCHRPFGLESIVPCRTFQ